MCLKLSILFLPAFYIVNITTKDYTIPYQNFTTVLSTP
jgi:hypothetical protein